MHQIKIKIKKTNALNKMLKMMKMTMKMKMSGAR